LAIGNVTMTSEDDENTRGQEARLRARRSQAF